MNWLRGGFARAVALPAAVALIVASPMATPAGAATVPGAPTIGTATGGVASVSVSFTAPASNGGSAITGYRAACSSFDGGAARSVAGSSSPIVVSPLTNGKSYTCKVTASNAVGTGAASGSSNVATVATVPGAPTSAAAASRNVSLLVTFAKPNFDGGTPITHYTASCASSNGGASGSATGAASPIIVNGLTNGRTYTCAVTATNAVGTGGSSGASNSSAPAVTVPDPPTITNTVAGNTAMAVTFTPPNNNGGSGITSYTVSCTSSNGGASGSASSSSSPITVNGLTNGRTYTCKVTATSALGTSVPSAPSSPKVPMTVPGAPVIGTATSRNLSLFVGFTGPNNNGGGAVTSYTASCVSSNGGASGTATGTGSPIIVNGLTNGRTYTCRVSATNAAGTGAQSGASNTAVPAVTVPDPPTNLVASSRNLGLSVSFSPPANNGGSAVTGYTVACESFNGGVSGTGSGTSSPVLVDDLTNGFSYTCTAKAASALGTSVPSDDSTVGVPGATVPDPPVGVTATSRNVSLAVGFIAPANNGGSAITKYTATCTSSNGGATGSASGGASKIIVNGLTNGRTYTCRVTATSARGTSVPSALSNTAVPAVTVPDPPKMGSATGINVSISVAFTPPANNGGSAITSYTATCVSSNGGATGVGSGSSSPVVVPSLSNGRTYTCTVRATSANGTSAPSAVSNPTTIATVPDAPSIGTARSRNVSLKVSFGEPSDDGGSAILSYTASCVSSNGGASGSATGGDSPIIVNGLTNGRTYTCRVTANNGIGPSAPSSASNAVVPAVTVPDPPTITGTVGKFGQMTVTFAAPANNGGSPITGYTVSCESSDGGAPGSAAGTASPLVVTPLTNGSVYTCTMTATTGLGTSVPSDESIPTLVATVPDAPTITHLSVNSGMLRISFVGPTDDGGSVITSYAAYCFSSNSGVARRRTGTTSPISVPGLTNGKLYSCSVTARNDVGAGGASGKTAAVWVGAPKAPTSVVAASLGASATEGSLRVSFTPGSDNGSEVTKYLARCGTVDGFAFSLRGRQIAGPDATPITVLHALTGRTYQCRVTAKNEFGESLGSTLSLPVTVGAPATPTAVKAVRTAAGQLKVTFKAGANNGAAISGYLVSCESDDGGVDVDVSTTTTSVTVSGLTVNKPYSCSVVAYNARGQSPQSEWSVPVLV